MYELLNQRVEIANLPTPIQYSPRISEWLGIELYIKRDDLTESIASGNKIRKLEYLIYDARKQGADALITCGGVQSNHCRAVAYAAAKTGMASLLLLRGQAPDSLQGNFLMDRLLGAQCRFFSSDKFRQLPDLFKEAAKDLKSEGRVPYVIPLGGSNATGSLGYVRMMKELQEANLDFRHLFCALGSGGTLAGILAGSRYFDFAGQIHAIAVSDDIPYFTSEVARIRQEFADWYGIDLQFPELARQMDDRYIGIGYSLNTPSEWTDLIKFARMEGLVLDPAYTLKAFLGMVDYCRSGKVKNGERIVFIHTGGHYGLFPKADELAPLL